MTRFQLVFRGTDGDQVELRDNATDGEPHIDGRLIVDGETYLLRDGEWILRREDLDGMPRFICTLVADRREQSSTVHASDLT